MKTAANILFAIFFAFSLVTYAGPATTSQFIKIDQFGYIPTDEKIAVISDPQIGYNAALSFTPGTTYEVRDWTTDAVVYSAAITPWNGGAIHAQSGDIVYWFDFSTVTTDGSYYIFDPTNNVGSYRFEISNCVYAEVMKRAMRVFYYQRCGIAKQTPFSDTGYTDKACHIGIGQDTDCRLYNNTNVSTSKDLSGGWHDAGDYNKYVNFAWGAMIDMLLAYEQNPTVWSDNYDIPESGNGVPDLLDEIKIELNWLLKMQNSDGSVLSVMGAGNGTFSPPSTDNRPRVYGPATTSASFSGAAVFALAAVQFKAVGQTDYATILQTAATNAWTWAIDHPNVQFFNTGLIAAGEQEINSTQYSTPLFERKFIAATFLYAATKTVAYKTFVEANYQTVHLIAWGKAYMYELFLQDALLYYAALPGATPTVASTIKTKYSNSLEFGTAENLPSYLNKKDAYRAFINDSEYHWGSNIGKGGLANMHLSMNYYNLNSVNASNYKNAAAGYLHYFHGVNPNSKTYLTNMGNYGAENSTNSIYHLWFTDRSPLWDEVGKSTYGPAPGYVPGGPNRDYSVDNCCPANCGNANSVCTSENLTPPKGQPVQKSWKDFNTEWPVNSFTITEPAIYYQANYIRMLSKFLNSNCVLTGISTSLNENCNLIKTIYPQPADDKVTITFYNHPAKLDCVLLDMNGKELLNKKNTYITGETLEIDLSSIAAGVYFIKIITADNMEVRKMVIN